MKVAVAGAGASGLAAAWELASNGCEVSVYEGGHIGGKLLTSEFLGRPVDEGPDAFLARVPEGVALCEEIGITGELEAPAASEALIFSEGKLYRLPEGLVLGAPQRLGALARSGVVSMRGLVRAAADLVLPAKAPGDDESVWDLVASRFGREVARKLVEPLVGGIYAGPTRGLSAAVAAPQLLAAARTRRSLLYGLRSVAGQRAPRPTGPVFLAPRSGMQAIADRLVERLSAEGTTFVRSEVSALRLDGRAVVVEPAGERFDGAVVTVPAFAAARLLAALGAGVGDLDWLPRLGWASVGVVTLALPEGALEVPGSVSGALVPEGGQMMLTACTFGSNKWKRWSVPGAIVLRVSVGRAGDSRWSALADEALVERCLDELWVVFGPPGRRRNRPHLAPLAWRVSRWPSSLPQYPVGHLQRVASLQSALRRLAPMVALAGASYGRVGVPACIASGRQAARELLAALAEPRRPAAGPLEDLRS